MTTPPEALKCRRGGIGQLLIPSHREDGLALKKPLRPLLARLAQLHQRHQQEFRAGGSCDGWLRRLAETLQDLVTAGFPHQHGQHGTGVDGQVDQRAGQKQLALGAGRAATRRRPSLPREQRRPDPGHSQEPGHLCPETRRDLVDHRGDRRPVGVSLLRRRNLLEEKQEMPSTATGSRNHCG